MDVNEKWIIVEAGDSLVLERVGRDGLVLERYTSCALCNTLRRIAESSSDLDTHQCKQISEVFGNMAANMEARDADSKK